MPGYKDSSTSTSSPSEISINDFPMKDSSNEVAFPVAGKFLFCLRVFVSSFTTFIKKLLLMSLTGQTVRLFFNDFRVVRLLHWYEKNKTFVSAN